MGLGSIPEMTVSGGAPGPFGVVLGRLVRPKVQKISQKFDGRIETIPLMPHNSGFGSIPEINVFFGARRQVGPKIKKNKKI